LRLLLVEDQEGFRRFIKKGLEEESYIVDAFDNGLDGLDAFLNTHYDLVILDIMMPGMNGLELIEKLRAKNTSIPIIFLTARDDIETKLEGFKLGCDDYLTKPFAFEELIARVRVMLKRSSVGGQETSSAMSIDNLKLDLDTYKVFRAGLEIQLTKKEFSILAYLIKNRGRVLSRSQILTGAWEYQFDTNTNVVDVHIRSLRNKINIEGEKPLIETVRGLGYIINEP